MGSLLDHLDKHLVFEALLKQMTESALHPGQRTETAFPGKADSEHVGKMINIGDLGNRRMDNMKGRHDINLLHLAIEKQPRKWDNKGAYKGGFVMTLTAFLDTWIQTYIAPRRAANTVKAYKYALAHLSDSIGGADLTDIDALSLQREVNALAAMYSRQAQILYTALRAALKKAVKLRLIEENPMEYVDAPEHETAESEILDPAECQAYINAAMDEPAGPLLVLMLLLGLRRNEARGLRCGDLDEEGILHIRQQRTRDGLGPLKSKSSRRELPIPEALRTFFSGEPGAFVVDVSEKSLRTQHRRTLSRIGCQKRVTLHGLRHSCATMAIIDGVDLVTVQKLLGHKHFSLTADLYAHADRTLLRRCTNVLFGSILIPSLTKAARLEIV